MEAGVRTQTYSEQQIEAAQNLMDKFMSIERKKRNLENQRLLVKIQEALIGVAKTLPETLQEPSTSHSQERCLDPPAVALTSSADGKPKKQRKFTKSLVVLENSHKCPYCSSSYETFKSLKRHAMKKHVDKPKISYQSFQSRNYVICLLTKRNNPSIRCKKEIEKARISRHLRESHGIERPDKKEFRGFLTEDSGETYKPCFAGFKEPDPPEIEEIEEDKEEDAGEEALHEIQPPEASAGGIENVSADKVSSTSNENAEKGGNSSDNPVVEEQIDDVFQDPSEEEVDTDQAKEVPAVTESVSSDKVTSNPVDMVGGSAKTPAFQEQISPAQFADFAEDQHTNADVIEVSEIAQDKEAKQVFVDVIQVPETLNLDILSASLNNDECHGAEKELAENPAIDNASCYVPPLCSLYKSFGDNAPELKDVLDEVPLIEIETKTTVNVEDDGSSVIIDQEEIVFDPACGYGSPNSQDIDSQESVFVSGAETHVFGSPNSPLTEFYLDSQDQFSCHNTGYHHLPSIPGEEPVVVLKFHKDNPKEAVKDTEKLPKEKARKGKAALKTKKKVLAKDKGSCGDEGRSKKKATASKKKKSVSEDKSSGGDEERGKKRAAASKKKKTVYKNKVGRKDKATEGKFEVRKRKSIDDKTTAAKKKKLNSDPDPVSEEEMSEEVLNKDDSTVYKLEVGNSREDSNIIEETEKDEDDKELSDVDSGDDNFSDEEEMQVEFKKTWDARKHLKPTQELHTIPENQLFISNFTKWWKECGASFVTTNKSTSTLRNSVNMLFFNQDSFLNFITSTNGSFNLQRLIMFTSEEYLAVPSPISWISKLGGENGKAQPSRRKSGLRAHQNIRSYINHCLNEHNFRGKEIQQKEAVSVHLKAIDDLIKAKKLFTQLDKLYEQQTNQKLKMQSILKPFEKENLHNCVSTWFLSKESDEIETEALEIYSQAKKSDYIRNPDYDRFVKIVFFELILFDKSRPSVLRNLTNEDYALKKETWVPPDMNDLEFNKLPKDWRLYKPPQPDVPPSSYEINLIGDKEGIKNQAEQTVCISQRVYELIEKMRYGLMFHI